jgi:hypothetical protein
MNADAMQVGWESGVWEKLPTPPAQDHWHIEMIEWFFEWADWLGADSLNN